MILPITMIELDDGTVAVFRTVDDASGWVEAVDVENGEYVAWDRRGLRLRLSVVGGRLRAEPDATSDVEENQLRSALISYLRSDETGMSLERLVEQALLQSEKEREAVRSTWLARLRRLAHRRPK